MKTIKTFLRNSFLGSIIFVQATIFPVAALAETEPSLTETDPAATTVVSEPVSETPPPPPAEETPPATITAVPEPATPGPSSPTGADRSTYSLNPDTGMWENGVYAWDPNTKQSQPLIPVDYSYNPSTGLWDTTQWIYAPEQGRYIPNVVSVATPPAGATITGTGPGSTNTINGAGAGDLLISNTGPDSSNSIDLGGNFNGAFDLFFNGTISNRLDQTAVTGNALVQGNTLGGNALTGDASNVANILNMLQSSWLGQSSNVASFVANLDGSVFGDLLIDPTRLPYQLGGAADANIDVNISRNSAINNDINMISRSGAAEVSGNTTGGNATSGDASAIANIINLINSAINANRSFIGMLNINGSLNGDILLPPGMLEALIASTGPSSTNTINAGQDVNLDANIDTTRSITNNIDLTSTSGQANVDSNTTAGSATSGGATTSVNQMNLIGQNVTANNALLVFINVMGSWVGLLMNAPSGSSSIAATGPDSTNTINAEGSLDVSVNADENSQINNNINLTAESGDATVARNTRGGNATTGDATTSVNLLNMINSRLEISDWFGVLFINVFGTWNGSFGVDTSAGESNGESATGAGDAEGAEVFGFEPSDSEGEAELAASTREFDFEGEGAATSDEQAPTAPPQIAAALGASGAPANAANQQASASQDSQNWVMPIVVMAVGGLLLAGERAVTLVRTRYTA